MESGFQKISIIVLQAYVIHFIISNGTVFRNSCVKYLEKRKIMQQKDDDQFSFIKEKIKQKPINKKRLLIQAGFIVGMAVVFGLVASLVFTYFQPKFAELLYPEEPPVVTIPQDSIAETEQTEETEEVEETQPQVVQEDMTEPSAEVSMPELEIADLQNVQNKLYAVGREANRFVVTVTGVKSDTDWFNNAYESKGQASGIIIADSGQELLILTERKVISDVQQVYVTFINDVTVEAAVKKYDGNTGITVLSVPRASVDEETMSAISVAQLGNSLTTKQGALVIAVGSPLGTNYSILTGNITSTDNSISTIDNNYTVFTTDIIGSSDGSGVIVNVDGEVIGLVMQDYGNKANQTTLTALSISELKKIIEMMSNDMDIPYIGLQLSTVTNDIAEEYDLPKGAYIKEVKMDSPAMAAGLQSGDVITKMDGETVYTVDGYESKLLALEPGDTVKIVVERQGTEKYEEITCTVEVGVLN